MTARHERWLDEDAGPVVRPYALTRGRTAPLPGLGLLDIVQACVRDDELSGVGPEQRTLVELSQVPVTVADLASDVDLPLNVVQILLGDLCRVGYVRVINTAAGGTPDEAAIRSVLDALRAL